MAENRGENDWVPLDATRSSFGTEQAGVMWNAWQSKGTRGKESKRSNCRVPPKVFTDFWMQSFTLLDKKLWLAVTEHSDLHIMDWIYISKFHAHVSHRRRDVLVGLILCTACLRGFHLHKMESRAPTFSCISHTPSEEISRSLQCSAICAHLHAGLWTAWWTCKRTST